MISRLLFSLGYENVRLVGGSGDKGADLIASRFNNRWLFQAKQWSRPVGITTLQETVKALTEYNAKIPVVVSSHGFESSAYDYQRILMSQGINMQLWDAEALIKQFNRLSNEHLNKKIPRDYQESAIQEVVHHYLDSKRALIVLATGLGKTFVAAEALRRINNINNVRTLVLAHTNPLVSQLSRQ